MLDIFYSGFLSFQYLFWQMALPVAILLAAFGYVWILLFIWRKIK